MNEKRICDFTHCESCPFPCTMHHIKQIKGELQNMASKKYIVKKNDNLWNIAKNELGDGRRYPEIVALNNLKTDVLQVGQVLKLPVSKPSETVSESHFEKIGKAFEKALNDVEQLESVKKLKELMGG